MTPLTMVQAGETRRIRQITGEDAAKRHLENLGFVTGEPVTVVSELAGNFIINVKRCRIAIDRKMADRIFI